MPLPTSTLASGNGLKSYMIWRTGWVYSLDSLQLAARFESSRSFGTGGKRSYAVTFQPPPNPSLLQHLVEALIRSGLPLTSWYVHPVDSVFSATSGSRGVGAGVE